MVKKVFIFGLLFIIHFVSAYSQKVGLVLSGGGAKGAVHIGIIKALEENDIPIDYIAGTSIGAIVGSLYAAGYTPDEMLGLFQSEEFYYWQTGKVEEDYQYYFRKAPNRPDFVRFNIPLKDSIAIRSALLPNSLINPIQMNQAFIGLYARAGAQCGGDFNKLFVPFLCVSSDVYNKMPIVFRKGDLGNAVRASMTFPLVFKPLIIDSVPLFDGGIYDNFPIRPMKNAFNPDFIIGSSVVGSKMKSPSEMDLYNMIENMVMQQTNYKVTPKDGMMMNFTLEDVNLMDFNKSKMLFDMGYQAATAMVDSIKKRIVRRIPMQELTAKREAYKATLPPLVFRHIYIDGVNDTQKQYIESQINRDDENSFTMEDFKQTYFHLLSNSKIKEILPHTVWDPENNAFDLYLNIQIKDEIMIAFGGNISSMSANQLYLGLGYQSLTELSVGLNLDMQMGNAYNGAAISGKIEIPSAISLDISGTAVYNYRNYYESEKLFIDTDVATFIHKREAYGKLSMGFPFLNKARMDVSFGYGRLEDKYYQTKGIYYENPFDKSVYNLFSFGLFYKKFTQDAKQYPIQGQDHHVYAQYISGKETYTAAKNEYPHKSFYQSWIQLDAFMYNLHPVNSWFHFGYTAEGLVSSKNLVSNYTASVLQAPAYTPTPHSKLIFNEAFRANQFLAGGVIPVLKINSTFHLRGDFHGFMPIYPFKRGENEKPYYGELFTRPAHLEEVSLVAQLPFMSIGLFANRYSYPKGNWNFGLNIGYLIFGPKFIP
ncbi:MAG: patatin-like phospholipase family protein [Dysgonamonadaceae bacterium]|jgi:NTE family protein|nr:patatin-like phospholipase family protein [Dysgonamonadaceae bacterium]